MPYAASNTGCAETAGMLAVVGLARAGRPDACRRGPRGMTTRMCPALLVVGDDDGKRIAVCAMLDRLGHPLLSTLIRVGRRCGRSLPGRFTVIVMDVRMPAMNGYETAKRIRARGRSDDAIVFMTDFGSDELETTAAYASGAVDFIFAPIAGDALRAKVTAFVELSARAHEHEDSLARSRRSLLRCETVKCGPKRCCRTSPTGL